MSLAPSRPKATAWREGSETLARRTAATGLTRVDVRRWVFWVVAALAIAWSAWLKIVPGLNDPFWLDEAWTGAIVGQPSWGAFAQQVYWDVNAPLYYMLMHVWQALFGLSDVSLRFPGLILALATPLIPALVPIEDLPLEGRLTWSAVLGLWFSGICYAQEARSYSPLLFLCTVQAVLFLRLMKAPGMGRALAWAAISAIAILTHYEALIVSGVQGLVYLAVHRVRAVKTWPAALAFVPAFGWIAYHLPRIADFTAPDIAWYGRLRWADVPRLLTFLSGNPDLRNGLGLIALYGLFQRLASLGMRTTGQRAPAHAWWTALAALIGAVLVISLGFARPSFTVRYLTPFAPGLFLGLVLVMRVLARDRIAATFVLTILMFGATSTTLMLKGERQAPKLYSFEQASRWLEQARPSRLVFVWDNPVVRIMHPEQLAALGGFFFDRDGRPVQVDPVIRPPDHDLNPVLLQQAAPGSAILWLYDYGVGRTSARLHPPRLNQIDPSWTCANFGRGRFGVLACERLSRGGQKGL